MEKKHPGGRPTKYKEEYCDKIIEYFRIEPTKTDYKEEYYNNGTLKSKTPVITAEIFPTFQGFADELDVSIDTLNEWCKVHPEFSEAYTRAKALQERIWLQNAMSGLYNPQFAQFFGKNCLGYKDKQELETKGEQKIVVELQGDVAEWSK